MSKDDARTVVESRLSTSFFQAIRTGNEEGSMKTVAEALTEGLDAPSIYLKVFQPALEEMGCLWERGEASVAEEHRASALTRWMMDALVNEFNPGAPRRNNATVLAGCVEGERHELGLVMVTRFLRHDGWWVVDLGADVPEADFVDMAAGLRPRICLLSAAMPDRLGALRSTISRLRDKGVDTPVLVGGKMFRENPTLYEQVGATMIAADPIGAVEKVRETQRE